jgi:hypothetical protein
MASNDDPCKEDAGTKPSGVVERCLWWLEAHPRTGWYIAIMATVNVILNLIDAFDLF